MAEVADGLQFFVQYCGKRNPTAWHTMAAFDVEGPARWYFEMQKSDVWDYRLVDAAGAALTTGERTK